MAHNQRIAANINTAKIMHVTLKPQRERLARDLMGSWACNHTIYYTGYWSPSRQAGVTFSNWCPSLVSILLDGKWFLQHLGHRPWQPLPPLFRVLRPLLFYPLLLPGITPAVQAEPGWKAGLGQTWPSGPETICRSEDRPSLSILQAVLSIWIYFGNCYLMGFLFF